MTLHFARPVGAMTLSVLAITSDPSFDANGRSRCAPSGTSWLWANFVKAKRTGAEPILPDFSYAGCRYSEESIPEVTEPVFPVTDYGAVPDDGEYDDAAIQQTIDAAASAGGGVVLFPPGRFLVSPNTNPNESRT